MTGEVGASCTYEYLLQSKWACPGQVYVEPDSSNALSGGSIFLIILVSLLFAYFVVGWFICAYMNRKDRGYGDVIGNIPHVTFWSKLPSLVFAGCCFTKDFVVSFVSKDGDKNEVGDQVTPYENIDDE